MNLPNRFLADLPPDAPLTDETIREACLTLGRNRRSHLLRRSTEDLIDLIHHTARDWCDPRNPYRHLALTQGALQLGFGAETLAEGLDQFFGSITRQSLNHLVLQELGHPERLDRLVASLVETTSQTAAIARGPELLVHVTAGNVPNPALMSIVLGLLTRSAQFIKCATGTSLLPRLFVHSLAHTDPNLASCLEIAEWPRDQTHLEAMLFSQADCVTVTGSDEAVQAIRNKLPPKVRFLGYGHRISFAFVASDAARSDLKSVAQAAARDVTAWNQLGCLSPHLVYVEGAADQFAPLLAEELALIEKTKPRGPLPAEVAALISGRRDFYQIRADHSPETRIWCSPNSTAWTVVYEADPLFQISCLHRFVHVKSVANLDEALRHAEPVRDSVSTVGLAASSSSTRKLATQLAAWGVTRVCPLGQMQRPPLTWRHDGRPVLGDLLAWTNWEQEF